MIVAVSAVICPAAVAQNPVVVDGIRTSGFALRAASGTAYEITEGSVVTYNTIASAAAAINDSAGDTAGWLIRNSGSIGIDPNGVAPNTGIYLSTTGSSTIINDATGFIRGNRSGNDYGGIISFNGHITLVNAGELRGTIGIRAYKGGYVTNSGLIVGSNQGVLLYAANDADANYQGVLVNTGEIRGVSQFGVRMDYYDSIVQNTGGSIIGEGSTTVGVRLARNGLLENTDGLIDATGHAVELVQGGTVAHNSGTISSTNRSGIHVTGNNSTRITLGSGAVITAMQDASNSYASIYSASTEVHLDNAGIILGARKALYFGTNADSVINNLAGGIIRNTVNLGAATAVAAASAAIGTNAAAITINNAGLIEGTPYGIYAGGGATITNTGTIGVTGSSPIAAIYFSSTNRAGSLTLGTGSVLEGNVVSNSGTFNRIMLVGSGAEDSHFIGASAATGFNSLSMDGDDWTLSGTVSLMGASAAALNVATGTLSIANTIAFGNAAGGATVAHGATLRVADNGNLTSSATGTAAKITLEGNLVFDRTDSFTYNGAISGSGSVTKNGTGTVTLSGSNTYGDTTINAGTLQGRIGAGILTVNTGGAYDAGAETEVIVGGLAGNGVMGLGSADLVFNVASGIGVFDFAGTITGGGQFIKTGSGTLDLQQTLTLGNGTLVREGVVRLDDQAKLGGGMVTLGGISTRGLLEYTGAADWTKDIGLTGTGGGFIIDGNANFTATATGAGDFVKSGSGVLDITGATMNNTGDTVVEEGTLRGHAATIKGDASVAEGAVVEFYQTVGGTYAGAISGSGALHKTGDGALNLTGANTYGDTRIGAGLVEGNIGVGTLTVESSGTYKMGAGSSVAVTGILGNGTIDLNNNNLVFDVASGVTGTFGFQGALNNGNDLIKTGAGTLELSNTVGLANAHIKDGAVKLDDQGKLNVGSITLGDTTTRGLLDYTGAADWAKDIGLAGAGGGFIIDGSASFTATVTGAGDFVKSGSGTLDITAATMNNTGDTVVDGGTLRGNAATIKGDTSVAEGATVEFYQITDGAYAGIISGSGALHKTGDGALNLTGANTYGDTLISAGLVEGNIGVGTLTVESSGTYKMGAGSSVAVTGILGNGTIDLNNNNLVFDVASGVTGTFGFQGALGNGNDFIKTGAGTLELNSTVSLANAHIKGGAVKLDDQGRLNVGSITLGDTSTRGLIEYTGAADWTKNIGLTGTGGGFIIDGNANFTATATGAGDFVKSGSGVLDITGATMNNTGGTVVEEGTLRGNAATIKGDAGVAEGAVVEFYQTVGGTYAGAISGSGALHKTGDGALTLDAATNSYGDTVIEQGMLIGTIGTGQLDINTSGTYKVRDGQQAYTTAGIAGDGTLDLNEADLVFDIASGTSAFSFSGSYTGADNNQLVKTGAGTLDLQTRAALSGGAAIKEGVVRLASQDFLDTDIILGDTATVGLLEYTGAAAWTKALKVTGAGGGFTVAAGADARFSGALSGDALFIKDGEGRLDATGAAFTNTGGMQVRSGTLAGTAQNIAAATEVQPGAVLEFAQANDGAYGGMLTGAGAFLKTGAGELTLSQAVGYSGETIVREGVVKAGAANIWLNTSRVVTEAGGAIDMGGFNQSIASLANNGAIILNATVNSVAGIIYSHDSLAVTGSASGAGRIRVRLNEAAFDGEPWSFDATLLEITGAGNPVYTAELDGRHVSGAYDWMVSRSIDGKTYTLSADQLSPEVPAVGGIDAAGYLIGRASLGGLSQRLMMARGNGIGHSFDFWTNGLYREDRLANALYNKARARTKGVQVGGDWNNKASTDDYFTIGMFYDYAETDMDLDGKTSSTTTKSHGVGLYASYRPGVVYADVIIRSAQEDYEIVVPGTRSFATEGTSIAASIEVGGRLPVEWSWNIEPQAQAVVQKHKVDNPTDAMGREYTIESADTLEGRVGVRIWRDIFVWNGGKRLTPYVRASLVYDWDGRGSVMVAGGKFDNYIGGSIGMIDAGASLQLAKHFDINIDGGWYAGSKLNGYTFNAALSLLW
ncbi:autotransporter outer membrane beta-barrel domain-containing protein [Termitidicoccus mucosus]